MATLLERIQQNIGALGGQSTTGGGGGMGDQTLKARNLLAARSGKALSPSAPAISAVGEQAAVNETQQQMGQVQQAGQMASAGIAQQVAAQEQDFSNAQRELNTRKQQLEQQARQRSGAILSELEQNRTQLNLDRDRAKLEQLSSDLALQDRKYVDELTRTGEMKRLNNKLNFDNEMALAVMGDSTEVLKKYLGNQSVLGASDRDFRRAMGRMEIGDALRLARIESRTARTAGIMSGLAGAGNAALAAYKPAAKEPASDFSGGTEDTAGGYGTLSRTTQLRTQ